MNDAYSLSLAKVSKSFGGVQAVRDVDMRVVKGERRALIGTNGAGKTTLFNLIAGDFFASAGSIEIFGRDVTRMPVHRRTRLGLRRTYQTPALFGGLRVWENLFLSLLGDASPFAAYNLFGSASRNTAARAKGAEMADRMGLGDKLEARAGDLSHGERKQLEIGMAMASEPRLLLLDEPAAGLSALERRNMLALLRGISREVTVIIIEHDMEMALNLADAVNVMHEGSMMAEGCPDAIRANREVQRVYLGEREDAAHS